jgi:hypothetical protein
VEHREYVHNGDPMGGMRGAERRYDLNHSLDERAAKTT